MANDAYQVFVALDGTALEGGKVFIGEANDDPELNPVNLYWDAAKTTPAAQPLRTSGGVIVRDGAPSDVFSDVTAYSIRIRDRADRLVWYKPTTGGVLADRMTFPIPGGPPGADSTVPGPADNTYSTLTTFKASDTARKTASLVGVPGVSDGRFNWTLGDFTGRADDVNIVKANSAALTVGAWVRQGTDGIAFQQTGVGAIVRPAQAKQREAISVADFGAKPDGATDSTAAFTAANAVATVFGKNLFFPAGAAAYMTDPVKGTTNWIGERGTVIKYRGTGNGYNPLVTFENLTDPVVEGITFDGNVSADPQNWATGYNGFVGAAGLRFLNCTNPRAIRVKAQNCSWSGIQFASCTNITADKCATKRTRGNFGDGMIVISCVGGVVSDFTAEDFTRIGLVLDSFGEGETIQTCRDIKISGVDAKNGHDASALYGGLEFNVGIWCENSANISISDCSTKNVVHRGINACTGPKPVGFVGTHAAITITNCQTEGGSWGIYTYSLNNLPVISEVSNCSVKQAVFAYEGDANNDIDAFTWVGNHADYDASSNVGRGFACEKPILSGRPAFTIEACTVSRWKENIAFLNAEDGSASTADVGTGASPSGPIKLTINSLRHVQDRPIYAKWFGNFAHGVSINDTDVHVSRGAASGGSVSIKGGELSSANIGNCVRATIKPNVVTGPVYVMANSVEFDAEVDIDGTGKVRLFSSTGGKYPSIVVKGARWQKNIATNGPVLEIGDAAGGTTIIKMDALYNKGGTTANPWMQYQNGGGVFYYSGVFADDSVTNIVGPVGQAATVTTVTGVTKIPMH